jgi:hypothetical protein
MDPLSALGLASGIVQLIDFTTNLIRTGVEIHGSLDGETFGNQNLEQVCERMSSVLETVKDLPASGSESDWLKRKTDIGQDSLKFHYESCQSYCKEVLVVQRNSKQRMVVANDGGRWRTPSSPS